MASPQNSQITWGILGTGWMAAQFAAALQQVPQATLGAVASRTPSSAQQFAQRFGIPQVCDSYADLVQTQIDIIYVATPHTRHAQDCLLCLEAGKAVLCEKPFMMNAREAEAVINLARSKHLFCMEAMWMRFMPLVQQARDLIRAGDIGPVRLLQADFGYPVEQDPTSRFFNPDLGGGALLDRGVYPLSLAFFLLGQPSDHQGFAHIGATGVDDQSALMLKYDNGAIALLASTLETYSSNTATIIGTAGKIVLHAPFYKPHRISITRFPKASTGGTGGTGGSLKDTLKAQLKQNPLVKRLRSLKPEAAQSLTSFEAYSDYYYQAHAVNQCMIQGQTESDVMPLDESLEILRVMDSLRDDWQLLYPQDIRG